MVNIPSLYSLNLQLAPANGQLKRFFLIDQRAWIKILGYLYPILKEITSCLSIIASQDQTIVPR